MADELFDLRNAVALGNHHQAIAEASQIKSSSKSAAEAVEVNAERDLLVARAQVGLGHFDAVLAEHATASHPLLKAAHAWASFCKALATGNKDAAEAAVGQLQALVGGAKAGTPGVPTVITTLVAAAHLHREEVSQALQLCGSWTEALDKERPQSGTGLSENTLSRQKVELRSIMVEALLRMARVDLADKVLQDMRAVDDDAVLTILSGVSVAIAQAASSGGSDRLAEAKSLVQDLTARCGQSTTLLNIAGVASLLGGEQQNGEQSLVSALSKRSTDVDTLSNLSAVAAATKQPEAQAKVLAQAMASSTDAAWTRNYAATQQRFRDAAEAFKTAA